MQKTSTWLTFAAGIGAGALLLGGASQFIGDALASTGQGGASAYSVSSFTTGTLYGAYIVDGRSGEVFIVKGHERPELLGRAATQ